MSETEAIELISARLEYVTKREASASRADDAAFLLTRLLIQRGFTDPTVDWNLPGANQIVLNVTEGPRSTLGQIIINGAEGEMADAMKKQIRSAHKAKTIDVVSKSSSENSALASLERP